MQLKGYETILAQLATELQRYLISRGAPSDVAADIVQDVFVKVLEMQLVLPPDKLRPYLYRVAWSTYLDQYRRQQRYQKIVTTYLVPRAEIASMPSALDDELEHALKRLSAAERQLLIWRYEESWSIKQVAQALKIRPAAAKMRLQRVQRKLEKMMRGNQDE